MTRMEFFMSRILEQSSWTIFLAIFVPLLCIYYYQTCINHLSKRLGHPGPTPLPILGHYWHFIRKGMLDADVSMVKEYGPVVGLSSGSQAEVLVADPDLLREIMTKQAHRFINRRTFELGTFMDNHLLALKDGRWKHVRSVMTPTFSSGKLRLVAQLIQTSNKTFLKNLTKCCDNEEAFECIKVFGNYTMDVISATAFGIHTDTQNTPDEPIQKNTKKVLEFSLLDPKLILILTFPSLTKYFEKIGIRLIEKDVMDFFHSLFEQLIEQRNTNEDNTKYKDFLQLMVNASKDDQKAHAGKERDDSKRGLTVEELMGNGMLFFAAGYDTTSQTLQFTAYHLATHPEWQDKVIQEVDDVIQGEEPNYDNVQTLPVMDMVINETLRLFPPGFRLDRVAGEDVHIDGWYFPKDTIMNLSFYALHHDPNLWPDPEKFDPNRFTSEAKSDRHPYAFLPFGAGPRSCIGMRLAQMELRMLLVSILQRYRFVTCDKTMIPLELDKFKPMRPKSGVWLKVVKRD